MSKGFEASRFAEGSKIGNLNPPLKTLSLKIQKKNMPRGQGVEEAKDMESKWIDFWAREKNMRRRQQVLYKRNNVKSAGDRWIAAKIGGKVKGVSKAGQKQFASQMFGVKHAVLGVSFPDAHHWDSQFYRCLFALTGSLSPVRTGGRSCRMPWSLSHGRWSYIPYTNVCPWGPKWPSFEPFKQRTSTFLERETDGVIQ